MESISFDTLKQIAILEENIICTLSYLEEDDLVILDIYFNDVFDFACSHIESIHLHEVDEYFQVWKVGGEDALIKYVAEKNDYQILKETEAYARYIESKNLRSSFKGKKKTKKGSKGYVNGNVRISLRRHKIGGFKKEIR